MDRVGSGVIVGRKGIVRGSIGSSGCSGRDRSHIDGMHIGNEFRPKGGRSRLQSIDRPAWK
jgi:hypothetical protein